MKWLKTMMDQILTGNEKCAQIRKGFDFLYAEFNTPRGAHPEVRREFYHPNPLCASAPMTITFSAATAGAYKPHFCHLHPQVLFGFTIVFLTLAIRG
ncbi:MAG: hypothetical protein ACLTSG_14295, partial [Lachnospiraceae bacterium]